MSLDEDTWWLDALAGRIDGTHSPADGAGAVGETTRSRALVLEALALREFIRVQELDVAATVPSVDITREGALLERARSQGLLPQPTAQPPAVGSAAPRRRWFAAPRITLAAAAMVLAALGVSLWRSTLPPIETLRGTVNGTVHLEADDPPALRRQLTEELNAAGVRVASYERLGHIGIDADLPQPVPAPIAALLERHHIPIPTDGALVIEIDTPSRR